MDGGAWKAAVHGVAEGWTRLSDFTFCLKGGVICISEVIDNSPGNLDSSLCFIYSSICIPFPIWNQSAVPYPVLTIAS